MVNFTTKLTSLIFVFLLLSLVFLGGCNRTVPDMTLASRFKTADPCASTERCLTLYVAPWCPYCRGLKPLVKQIDSIVEESGSNVGFKVIVGRADPAELEVFGKSFGQKFNVYYDPDGAFFKKLRGGGVPAWFLWDEEGVVLRTLSGAPQIQTTEAATRKFLNQTFSLGSYLE